MTDLYLYQIVHIARGRALHVDEHAALLDAASREWFDRRFTPSVSVLKRQIELRAEAEFYPTEVSGFIRIELRPDGEVQLLPAGISLYDGYGYRSVQPSAVTLRYDLPLTEAPTSAREAATLLARRAAERQGAGAVIRCDAGGTFREADGAPLFAIVGRTVIEAPGAASVERSITRQAVVRAGLELRSEPFGLDDLNRLEELFFTDHRGITSLSHCNGLPLMTFLAERIAAALE